MKTALLILVSLSMPSQAAPHLFGDFNHRNAAIVASDLDSVGAISGESFDELAPEVLRLVKEAKPTALATRALDVLCAKAGPQRSSELAAYLGECFDGLQDDRNLRKHVLIEALVTRDSSLWGPGFRGSPAALALLVRIGGVTDQRLDPNLLGLTIDAILQLAASDSQRRSILLGLISSCSMGATFAADRIVPLLDNTTRQALRDILSGQVFNRFAAQALSDAGDAAVLPLLESRRAQAEQQSPRGDVAFIDQSIRKVGLLNPSENLFGFLRSPGNDSSLHYWAIRKARELNLDHERVRSAITDWAGTAEAWQVVAVKEYAQSLGVLEASDLPSASQPSYRRFISEGPPERRTGTVEVPDRRAKAGRWRPNTANYDAFFGWYRGQNRQTWRALPEAERVRRIRLRLCQLDLLSPEACEQGASSQPSIP